jgi:hypothetical protein
LRAGATATSNAAALKDKRKIEPIFGIVSTPPDKGGRPSMEARAPAMTAPPHEKALS